VSDKQHLHYTEKLAKHYYGLEVAKGFVVMLFVGWFVWTFLIPPMLKTIFLDLGVVLAAVVLFAGIRRVFQK
jgi:hypothetical protein